MSWPPGLSRDEMIVSRDEMVVSCDEMIVSRDEIIVSRDEIIMSRDEIIVSHDNKKLILYDDSDDMKLTVASLMRLFILNCWFMIGLSRYVTGAMPYFSDNVGNTIKYRYLCIVLFMNVLFRLKEVIT